MQTGYQVNKAKEELIVVLQDVLPLTRDGAERIVEPLMALLDAAIPMQNITL